MTTDDIPERPRWTVHSSQFGQGGPDWPLDEHPGEAAEAEEEGDGEQDVGHQRKEDWTPVNLETVFVLWKMGYEICILS